MAAITTVNSKSLTKNPSKGNTSKPNLAVPSRVKSGRESDVLNDSGHAGDTNTNILDNEFNAFQAGIERLQSNLLLGIRESIEIDSIIGRPLDEDDMLLGELANNRWDQP